MNRILHFLLFGIIGVLTLHACSKARKMQKVDHPEPVVQNQLVVTEESAAPSTVSAWEQACEQNSIEAYTEFLKKYPNDRHTNEAWERIEELWKEKAQRDKTAEPTAAMEDKPVEAPKAFPKDRDHDNEEAVEPQQTPLPKPTREPGSSENEGPVTTPPAVANAKPAAKTTTPIPRASASGTTVKINPAATSTTTDNSSTVSGTTEEEQAWDYASHSTAIPVIERFVQNHPGSVHRAEAEKRIIDLEVDKIMAGKPAKLPPLEKVKDRPGAGNNTVTIRNYTDYQLSVWFSGPGSVKKVLPSGQQGTLHLPNGSYRVAAAVNSASVNTYAATEQLNGGEYESDFYIISAKD